MHNNSKVYAGDSVPTEHSSAYIGICEKFRDVGHRFGTFKVLTSNIDTAKEKENLMDYNALHMVGNILENRYSSLDERIAELKKKGEELKTTKPTYYKHPPPRPQEKRPKKPEVDAATQQNRLVERLTKIFPEEPKQVGSAQPVQNVKLEALNAVFKSRTLIDEFANNHKVT